MNKFNAVIGGCLLLIGLWSDAFGQQVFSSFSIPATICTNQFIRSIAAATGVGTCASVAIGSDVSGLGTGVATALGNNANAASGFPTQPNISTAWTPADGSGAALTFTSVNAAYTRIGNIVFAYATLTYPSTVDGSNATISGLPIAVPNQSYAAQCSMTATGSTTGQRLQVNPGFSSIFILTGATNNNVTNAQMTGATIKFMCIYPVT